MRRLLIILIVCVLVSAPVVGFSTTEKRVALVIGNGNYMAAPLRNPVNDANDMASELRRLGFSVTLKTDATQRTMERAIRDFGKQLREGGVGLFYYAGHGVQVKGSNYLLPIGAVVESEGDVKYEAVDAGLVLAKMEDAGNGLNIIVLDACRDNPFARSFRSGSRGLAKMDAPTGSILAYSTAPGSVAADGTGSNGLYTQYLLKHISNSKVKIEDVFKQVRIDVIRESGKKQTPWESSSLTGNFFFHPDKTVSSQPARAIAVEQRRTPQNLNAEEEMWEIVKTSEFIESYKIFLDEYPSSRFSGAAKLKIQQIKRKQSAQKLASINQKPERDERKGTLNSDKKIELAIFPCRILESSIFTFDKHQFLDDIAELLERYKSVHLTHSFYTCNNCSLFRNVKIFDGTITEEVKRKVWQKKTMFSKNEPNREIIDELINKSIPVELVLLYEIDIRGLEASIKGYLIDIEKNVVVSENIKSQSSSAQFLGYGEMINMTKKMLDSYMKNL